MSPTKTPTSSLSAIELLAKRVWYRSQARIRQLFLASASQGVLTACLPPVAKLPQEIFEMIIIHLIHDKRSLLACSLTCYSWYIATVPHLHHTLSIPHHGWHRRPGHGWPTPLWNASRLGLLPLVRKFKFCEDSGCTGFSPQLFNRPTLRQFSTLTNIQELEIDSLDIPRFMPKVWRYFGHFLPTTRSLTLKTPKGSRREIIFFIGLFQHLENLTLLNRSARWGMSEPANDLTLIPPFTPPLRGRLVMAHFTSPVGFSRDMIDLFGGIRFHYMNLFDVSEARLLLSACAETLETLRLDPTDPQVGSSLLGLDLSRNKSLRAFEIEAQSIIPRWRPRTQHSATWNFLRTVLSTIASPAFSEVVVFYLDRDFAGTELLPSHPSNCRRRLTPTESAEEDSWHRGLFEVLREMYTVRDFRLVLTAEVVDWFREYTVGAVKRAVATEKAAKRLDYLSSEPMVVHIPQSALYPLYLNYSRRVEGFW